jgi:hypothetical protein
LAFVWVVHIAPLRLVVALGTSMAVLALKAPKPALDEAYGA